MTWRAWRLPLPTAKDMPHSLSHAEHALPGPDGNEITVSVFRRKELSPTTNRRLGVSHIHGGGMVIGNRFTHIAWALEAVKKLDAVCVSVEYRLAPMHPDPAPVEDCYAGLVWTFAHADELGIDPARIIVTGPSAGAGLAAGITLLARDGNGPRLLGQALHRPMIDNRNDSLSTRQFDGLGIWDRQANKMGWGALLGDRRGTDSVSIYAAPLRATDLSGLPPACIDVGSNETFREEAVEYARRLWRDGVAAWLWRGCSAVAIGHRVCGGEDSVVAEVDGVG